MKTKARNLKAGDVIMGSDGPILVDSVQLLVRGRDGGSFELDSESKVDVLRKAQ